MEYGEDFIVQFYNGSQWLTIANYRSGTDFSNYQFNEAVVNLLSDDYSFANNSSFRIVCDASSNSDDVYLDEIILKGLK